MLAQGVVPPFVWSSCVAAKQPLKQHGMACDSYRGMPLSGLADGFLCVFSKCGALSVSAAIRRYTNHCGILLCVVGCRLMHAYDEHGKANRRLRACSFPKYDRWPLIDTRLILELQSVPSDQPVTSKCLELAQTAAFPTRV